MKKDILSRSDIKTLVNAFYKKVFADAKIGFFFVEVANIEVELHFQKITDFWEGILFQKMNYKGNPMKTHLELNEKIALDTAHFERWLLLFNETIDEMFQGENTEKAKQSAISVAALIQTKLRRSNFPISS